MQGIGELMAKLDIKIDLPSDAELKRMFDAVPILERYKVSDKVVRAAAKPVVKRARQLAPRSTPEARAKRSKKQRESAEWDYPLWKTIAVVVRKYQQARGTAIVGPRWPTGNKAYFNTSPKGRRRVLWGRNVSVFIGSKLSPIAPQIRNWIVQAYDETRTEQLAIMKTKLKELMDEIWRSR